MTKTFSIAPEAFRFDTVPRFRHILLASCLQLLTTGATVTPTPPATANFASGGRAHHHLAPVDQPQKDQVSMKALWLAAGLTLFGAAPPAMAAIVSGSYTGTIGPAFVGNTDTNHFFGSGSLEGAQATLDFSYDTSLLQYSSSSQADTLQTTNHDGSITASLTINGVTISGSNASGSSSSFIRAQANSDGTEGIFFNTDISTQITVDFQLETKGPNGAGWVDGAILGADPFGMLVPYDDVNGGFIQAVHIGVAGYQPELIYFYQTPADQAAGTNGAGMQSSDVPEPGTALLLVAPVLVLLRRSQQGRRRAEPFWTPVSLA